jgi:hypothetical protein
MCANLLNFGHNTDEFLGYFALQFRSQANIQLAVLSDMSLTDDSLTYTVTTFPSFFGPNTCRVDCVNLPTSSCGSLTG